MGSYKWGYKSPNMGYNYRWPTYNYPWTSTPRRQPFTCLGYPNADIIAKANHEVPLCMTGQLELVVKGLGFGDLCRGFLQ